MAHTSDLDIDRALAATPRALFQPEGARNLTRKVITAEDPIAYSIAHVQQTQVRPELGFGFAQAMREGTPEGFRCFQGAGCAHCGGRGTHGRIAVVEWLRTGSEIRRAITRGLPVDDVRAAAERAGLRSLREQALAHVQEGLIPFAELAWVLPPERMAAARAPYPTRP